MAEPSYSRLRVCPTHRISDDIFMECWTCGQFLCSRCQEGGNGLYRLLLLENKFTFSGDMDRFNPKTYFISEQEIDQLAKDLQCNEFKEVLYRYMDYHKKEYGWDDEWDDDEEGYDGCDLVKPVDVSDILGPNVKCNSFFDMLDQVSEFIIKNRDTPEKVRPAINSLFGSYMMGFDEDYFARYKCDECYKNNRV
jgi:hypothetical protein